MNRIALAALSTAFLFSASAPAFALSSKECSTKFKAATADGSASGRKYADYRKAECGAGASAMPAAATAAAPEPAPARAAPTARRGATAAPGEVAYPSAIDPRYAKESAGKGRMHTCLDAYKAAKAAGTLGTTKWIQKGGGYYSTCNSRLKA